MKRFSVISMLAVFLVSCGQNESDSVDGDFLALCKRLQKNGGNTGTDIVLELGLADRQYVARDIVSTASYFMDKNDQQRCVRYLQNEFLIRQARGGNPRLR